MNEKKPWFFQLGNTEKKCIKERASKPYQGNYDYFALLRILNCLKFINIFYIFLLSIYCVPGIILGKWDSAVNGSHKTAATTELTF